jgi:tetratricopeptide (TPR) repeat protein
MNLAALRLRLDDKIGALDALDTARSVNVRTPASLRWAQLAEELNTAAPQVIVESYLTYILITPAKPALPLSDFWWQTNLRRQTVEEFLTKAAERVDWQYRVLAVHDPERAYALVPASPQTAAEYWVAGEYTLTVRNDPAQAVTFFTGAIERTRTEGDYYASRARAESKFDAAAARRDLDIATLLGTSNEYPNAVRAELAATSGEAQKLRADALPPRQLTQEFAAALYGRPAVFDLLPEVRAVGPGRAAMQPWYTIADDYLAAGQTDKAINVYRAILDYAPDETEARDQLQVLTAQ